MNDIEKAIRFICLFDTDDDEAKISRYEEIYKIIHGDSNLIRKYVKRYHKMIDMLTS